MLEVARVSNQAWMKEKIPEANETLKNFKVKKKVEKVEFFKVGAIRKNFSDYILLADTNFTVQLKLAN